MKISIFNQIKVSVQIRCREYVTLLRTYELNSIYSSDVLEDFIFEAGLNYSPSAY